MDVVIVAGGKGRRMGEITKKIPKSLIKIKGKPIIEYVLDSIPDTVNKIYILTNYKSKEIKDYFNCKLNNDKYKVVNIFSGGTLDALKKMPLKVSNRFIYVHGNIIFKKYLIPYIIKNFNDNCICISKQFIAPSHPRIRIKNHSISEVKIDNNCYQNNDWYCSMGVAIINKELLNNTINLKNDAMMEEVLIPSIKKGENIEVYEYDDIWFHLQTVIDLKEIEKKLDMLNWI